MIFFIKYEFYVIIKVKDFNFINLQSTYLIQKMYMFIIFNNIKLSILYNI